MSLTDGFIQIFIGKSHVPSSAGSVVFYPPHVNLLTIAEEVIRGRASQRSTTAAYLPVSFEDDLETDETKKKLLHLCSAKRKTNLAEILLCEVYITALRKV